MTSYSSLISEAQSVASIVCQAAVEKVASLTYPMLTVRLRAVAMPLFKKSSVRLSRRYTVGALQELIRARLSVLTVPNQTGSLTVFVAGFAPSPSQALGELADLFANGDNELTVSFSAQETWG
jgi:hypothetical protein